ncbi:hypothetical protein PVAP13_9KG446800 [Panicum virgatum]|uniref:Uncharacterized protein n=1 Tax=Panicum virgatum TaxID=38727 RepID=A0A8T0NYZ1_PANVG|nr:hypothetical protein PVAP13_9KG446800 [Panicum virgatum]
MADYCHTSMPELDDVHRLLPPEILEDIGIIVDPAEQQLLDVVEDLAARLPVVLGGSDPNIASSRRPHANAARGLGGTGIVLTGPRGNNVRRRAAVPLPAPPLNSPAPPVPRWHAMAGVRNDMVFAPAPMPLGASAQPTTVRRGAGTGVFLPRTEGSSSCRTAKAAARPPGNGQDSPRCFHRRGQQQAATVAVKTMHPVAGQIVMEQNYLGVHARPVFSRATTGTSLFLRHESYSNHGSFQALHACIAP